MLQEITMRQIDDFFHSADDTIDQLGAIDKKIKELEAVKAKLKAAILAKGKGVYQGVNYFVEVQEYDRPTISAILVKEFGTTDFVAQVTQMQHVKAVVVRPID